MNLKVPETLSEALTMRAEVLQAKEELSDKVVSQLQETHEMDDEGMTHYGYLTFMAEELGRQIEKAQKYNVYDRGERKE